MTHTIVCLDDDPDVLTLVARVLRREGLEVRTTESSSDALAWIVNDHVAVLVSDYDMPGITGAQVCSQARKLRPETVRVLLTGQRDLQTAIEGINQGEVFRFISKPFDHKELRDVVAEAVERHEELVELSGERVRRDRSRTLKAALEEEYPGISEVKREVDGRYVVREVGEVVEELARLGGTS